MRLAVMAAAALAFAAAARAEEPCRLVRVASLEISLDRYNRPTVPAMIEGHPARVLVDTGGVFSAIAPEWLAKNGIKSESLGGGAVYLWGGARLNAIARVRSFELGKLSTGHMSFAVLPPNYGDPDVAASIGAEVLGAYDVDFDFAAGRLNLFRKNDCAERVIYWTADMWAVAPLRPTDDDHLVIDAQLDGKTLRAMIDTGASDSVLNLDRARGIFGWDSKTPLQSVATDVYRFPFKALSFDAVEVHNPSLALVPDDRIGFSYSPREAPLLLGMNVLRNLHVYVSYGQHKVYFTAASAH